MTEKKMRETKVIQPKSLKELLKYIEDLLKENDDYGKAVYAVSMAATATFNYMAFECGITAFQASCADLDIIRRVRLLKGPFMLVNLEDALYPQDGLLENKVKKFRNSEDSKKWLKETAIKNLEESPDAHEEVIAHWKKLAALD